ncbi:MBL fold metallo-hydrolase RNA specificity domain-containing protein [Halostreptopolyspora alba]|uniref:Zn-dependent metallo-hydrolase RNA specificity domain-containing protein n=1 Tax=Halostreptopolyspora alba TaxID=2487137 RepID=A0A3N0EGX0_9ACTN|nr:hypothetical protein EFW17_03375 [Nocardiopsaceae bacterium YIM 96095]
MAERRHEHDCDQHCLSHTCEPGCDAAFQSELGSDLADQDHLSAEHVRAVPRLDIKQLHDTLRALPPRFARSYLNGRPPSMDAAKRVHERLYRSPEHNRNRELLMLAPPVTALVRAPRGLGLDARACASLLTGHDSAHTTAETHPTSAVTLSDTAHLPDAMRLAALAATLVSCRPAPPMAVALLLADPAVPPEVAEVLASFWAAMRERTSALPAAPASLPDLVETGKTAMKRIGTTPPQHESTDTSHPATSTPHGDTTATMTDPAPATHSDDRAPDIDELTDALTRLRSAFAEATDSARTIHDTLTRGCRPEQAALDRIGALAGDMDRLGHKLKLRAVTGAETPAASLDELEAELGRAREHRKHAGIRSRFAALEGPEGVAPALTEIREAANSADNDENVTERLRLLAELVDRTEQDPYDSACAELLQRVMAQTPASWHSAVMAAMHGQLTLGAAAPPSAEPATEDPPTAGDDTPAGTPSEDALADLDAALARETGQDTETPAPPEEPTPAPSAEPDATPPQEADASTAVPSHGSAPAATPTEAAAPSPSMPSAPAATDPRSEIAGELERTAMEQHRFGLAAWLKRAAEAPENAATTRYVAACAEKIQDSTGPMAEAFRERAQLLCDDLPTEPADRLLAWAAATRAVLVAPTLEATQLIEQTSVVTSGRPGLNGMRLSAHADRRGLLEIAREVGAGQTHLVHGHLAQQQEFGRVLEDAGLGWSADREGIAVKV